MEKANNPDLAVVKKIVAEVEQKVRPRRAKFSDIKLTGKRTPREILESGWTNQFNCLEKAAVIGAKIRELEYPTQIIGVGMKDKKGKPAPMHFYLMVNSPAGLIYINPLSERSIVSERFYRGLNGQMEFNLSPKRWEIPENAMDIPTFKLIGVKGISGFCKLSEMKRSKLALNFVKRSNAASKAKRAVKRVGRRIARKTTKIFGGGKRRKAK